MSDGTGPLRAAIQSRQPGPGSVARILVEQAWITFVANVHHAETTYQDAGESGWTEFANQLCLAAETYTATVRDAHDRWQRERFGVTGPVR